MTAWFEPTMRTERVRAYLDLNAGYWKDEDQQFAEDVAALNDAIELIALADTHHPAMPAGFVGDWKVLRDIAVAACALEAENSQSRSAGE